MKNLFNRLTDTRQKKIIFSIVSSFLVFLLCFGLSKTNFVRNLLKMAGIYTQEEKVIEFYSDGWEENEPGSIKVTKSADWVAEDTAEITFDIESKRDRVIPNRDTILVVNTSFIEYDNAREKIIESLNYYVDELLNNSSNNIALITFNSESTIISDFTNDADVLKNAISDINKTKGTSYYSALKDLDTLLSSYVGVEGKPVVTEFIVFNESDSSGDETYYDVLKEKYDYLYIRGYSACPWSSYIFPGLEQITDISTKAHPSTLKTDLFEFASYKYYEQLVLTDYIDDDFYIEDESQINIPYGEIELKDEDGTQKITWTIPKNKYKSGNKTSINIRVKLDSKYINKENYYATNKKESITYNFDDEDSITLSSTSTPVLKNGYRVFYDANPPEGCGISALNEYTYNVFSEVAISNENPFCQGFEFAGWEIVTDGVKKISESEFIMPSYNVDIKGTWKKLGISKSMEGTIYEKPSLFETVQGQSLGTDVENSIDFSEISSDTNGKGVYTLSGTENDEYPVYYYRGAVTNNNVLFANFCWKMVRTTDTGGVKLIYNGVPTNGTCNNTGTASQLSATSMFNTNNKSHAYSGYMYGNVYSYREGVMTWHNQYLNQDYVTVSPMTSTNYIYGKNVSYSGSSYTITDAENYTWDDNYSNLLGYYTCLSETGKKCSSIYYIIYTNPGILRYVELADGDTFATISEYLNNNPYIFGNDVIYKNGVYTIENNLSFSIFDWEDEYKKLSNYHYTCLNSEASCETVYYIYFAGSSKIFYIPLTSGKTIEDAIAEMTSSSTNKYSSKVKTVIDNWYASYMINYTNYLEDTIWCNDRSIYDLAGWSKSGTITNNMLYGVYGRMYKTYKPSLECPNVVDQFSVSNEKAKLTYPVALLTADEVNLAGGNLSSNNTYYLYTGQSYWLLSPSDYYNFGMRELNVYQTGSLQYYYVNGARGVRPAVSLASGIQYTDGDGSVEDPYVVDTSS